MRKAIEFSVPLSGFAGLTFINCFTSAYAHMEGLASAADPIYACNKREKGVCDNCGRCRDIPGAVQERWFFLFDTVCGRSAMRCRWSEEPTAAQTKICETDFYDGGAEDNVDFLFGYAGYAYRKLTEPEAFPAALAASVEAGRPAIAKTREGWARFRLLTGYDGETPLEPEYKNAQHPPEKAVCWADVEALYVIGEKTAPRYGFLDALRRIRAVLADNEVADAWGSYMQWIGLYGAHSLDEADAAGKKERMGRVAEAMWHTFNCHNFAEVFRHRMTKELQDPRMDSVCQLIGGPFCGYTHDLAWALINLNDTADWTKPMSRFTGEMVELTLSQIQRNDANVREQIDIAIGLLES